MFTPANIYILMASTFVVMLGFGIIIPVLPFFATAVGASSFHVGLLISAFAVAQLLAAPYWGALSDRIGRKPVIVANLFGLGASMAAISLVDSVAGLLGLRLLAGLCAGGVMPTSEAYVADVTAPQQRARALGRIGAGQWLGFLCGPSVGALLVPLGFPVVFLAGGGATVLSGLAALCFLRESGQRRQAAGGHGPVWGRLLAALRSPIAPLLLLGFVVTVGGSSFFSMFALYVKDRFDGSATLAGWLFTIFAVANLVFLVVALSRLTRRLGEVGTVSVGLAVGAVGLAAAALAPNAAAMAVAVTVLGALAVVRPTLTALISQRTPFPQGITLGLHGAADALGRTIGPIWAGWIYSFGAALPFSSAAVLLAIATVWVAWPGRRA